MKSLKEALFKIISAVHITDSLYLLHVYAVKNVINNIAQKSILKFSTLKKKLYHKSI